MAVGMLLLSRLDVGTSMLVADLYMFVVGLGLGFVMQVLVLAVQNAVDYANLGVATVDARRSSARWAERSACRSSARSSPTSSRRELARAAAARRRGQLPAAPRPGAHRRAAGRGARAVRRRLRARCIRCS